LITDLFLNRLHAYVLLGTRRSLKGCTRFVAKYVVGFRPI